MSLRLRKSYTYQEKNSTMNSTTLQLIKNQYQLSFQKKNWYVVKKCRHHGCAKYTLIKLLQYQHNIL